jgi:subtilisin family serine protease
MIATSADELLPIPFLSASGRGIRVAVIDSGINSAHPHICTPAKTVRVAGAGSRGVDSGEVYSSEDTLGHGTAVMAAIQEKAPAAEYFAVKLFGSSLRATTTRLLNAIEWAIDSRMDVVNLSLGTTNLNEWAKFQALAERASSEGVVLVSARSSSIRPLLPGALPAVIGVDIDWDLPRHRYRIASADGRSYFFASGYPRPMPGVSPARNLSGISFAVANMTGFVARACEGLPKRSFQTVRDALAAELQKQQAAERGAMTVSRVPKALPAQSLGWNSAIA